MSAPLRRQVAAATCLAATAAVLLAGLLSLPLVRGAYDGEARAVLHREAVLVARLAERAGTSQATRPGRPAGRLLTSAGVTVVRVLADGRRTTPAVPVDPTDLAAASAGTARQVQHRVGGRSTLVDVEPVLAADGSPDGGVVLQQALADAQAPTRGALRRLLLALLAGLAVAAVLGVALAARLARPVRRAAAAARSLAAGERDVRVLPEGPAEVAELASALDGLADALARSESRQRSFLLSVSHELRTPLTAVRGYAEALADGVAADDARRAGAVIRREAERLERLVSDLLALARLQADDFRLEQRDVDVGALLTAAGEAWRPRTREVGAVLRVEAPAAPLVVRSDATRLRQVLDNLLDNALRVAPPGAAVVLAARPAGGTAVLEVRDGGPGLADEDLAVAFTPRALHDRAPAERRGSSGLGLALVAGLAERLGGSVTAAHAPEGGLAVRVALPSTLPDGERRQLLPMKPPVGSPEGNS